MLGTDRMDIDRYTARIPGSSVNINPNMYNQRAMGNMPSNNSTLLSNGGHGFPNSNNNQQQQPASMDQIREDLMAGNYPHNQQSYLELLWRPPPGSAQQNPAPPQSREVAPPSHLNFAQNNSMSLPNSSSKNDISLAGNCGPGSTRSMLDQLLNNDPDAIIQELEQLLGKCCTSYCP